MPRDARFWRNVTIIAVAHIAIIITLVLWNRETRKPNLQSIVWMSGGGTEVAAQSTSASPEAAIEKTPPPEADTPRSKPEEQDEPPDPTSARSDIHLPTVTPSPSRPSMTPVPKDSPKPTAKPTPKATPKNCCGKGYAEAFAEKESDDR